MRSFSSPKKQIFITHADLMVIFVTKLALIFLHSKIKVRTASESNDLIYSTSPHLYKVILHKIRHILSKTLKMLTGFFNVVCAYFTLSKHDVLFKELNPFFSCTLIAQPHRPSTLCQRSRATAFFFARTHIRPYPLTLPCTHFQRNKRRTKKLK